MDFATILHPPYVDWLLDGLAITLGLFTISWVLGMVIAIALVIIRMTGFRPAVLLVTIYVEFMRNVPLLVHVLFWYFAMPTLLPLEAQTWLNQNNTEFTLAGLALSFVMGAYFSEVLRSGIRAVSRHQIEAGRSLGFGFLMTARYVVLPQVFRTTVPPLTNMTLLLFKNTSIAMAIGVHELTYQTRAIENETFMTFEVFAVCTAMYFIGSFLLMMTGAYFEKRYRLERR